MTSEVLQSQLRALAEDLGIPIGELRTFLADELAAIFRGEMAALRQPFRDGVAKRISIDLDVDERKVRSHLNGESKPGRLWPKYHDWFVQSIPRELPNAELAPARGHLEVAGRILKTWSIWSRQGRPSASTEFPLELGDEEIVMRAIGVLQGKNGGPATSAASAASVMSPLAEQAIPLDLQPPACNKLASRPYYSERLSSLAKQFVVVVQGPPGSGKRHVVLEYLAALAKPTLWCHLTDTTTFADVTSRISETIGCPNTLGHVHAKLADLDMVLVLDGINPANVSTFSQALQKGANLPGPVHIIATSRIRVERIDAVEVAALSPAELAAFLKSAKLDASPSFIQELANSSPLYPLNLMRALASCGGDPTSLLGASRWRLGEISAHLNLIERQALELVGHLGETFDSYSFQCALDGLNVATPALEMLTDLESRFALLRLAKSTWRICAGSDHTNQPLVPSDVRKQVLSRIGVHFENLALDAGRPRKPPSHDDCLHAYRACLAYQIARAQFAPKDRLLAWFGPILRAKGMLSELRQLYEFELTHNQRRARWIDLKLANCMHIQGELRGELKVLERLFYELTAEARDPNLLLNAVRAIAELLIDVGHPETAASILNGAFLKYKISNLHAGVASQAVSMLSWALMFSGRIAESLELNERILGRQFSGIETEMAEAVRQARLGIALKRNGDIALSIDALVRANNLFEGIDRRGYAWTAVNLAESYRLDRKFEAACRWFREATEITAMYGMFDAEFYSISERFANDDACLSVKQESMLEMERVREYELTRRSLSQEILDGDFAKHLLLAFGATEFAGTGIDVSKYELIPSLTTHKMRSEFNRTLVSRMVKDNPERQLQEIFARNKIDYIFAQPLLNKIITSACEALPHLANQYIRPHLETIRAQKDSVRLHYARYFEIGGNPHAAENLLESVEMKGGFDYFNIKANCAKHERARFGEAMMLNEQALACARHPMARARIQTNIASLLYEHDITNEFSHAAQLCKDALASDKRGQFTWPSRLLLKLELAIDDGSRTTTIIEAHRNQFAVSLGQIKTHVIDQIVHPQIRRRALASLKQLGWKPRTA